ncbi:Hypp3726 [Branchiostoma lanceolatum]|uniref:Hypp3726 protein n=1 Tax=Branchiostoma lanceolatum TaxID=7740 RepID=A0A8K0A3T6_BRALA|nr:Hypp3726 [Branchiostoma lanceolatum]
MNVSLSSLEAYTPDWKALSCDNTSPQPRHLTREDDGQVQSPGEWRCRVGNQTTNNGVSLPFIGDGKGDLSDAALSDSTFLTGTWAQNYHRSDMHPYSSVTDSGQVFRLAQELDTPTSTSPTGDHLIMCKFLHKPG